MPVSVLRGLALATLFLFTSLAGSVSAEIPWERSPQRAFEAAQASGKPILVFVSTDWCHYCTKMKKETWSNPRVESTVSSNFVTLVLDGDKDVEVVRKLGLSGYPATLLYTPGGEFMAKKGGFMPANSAVAFLNQATRR